MTVKVVTVGEARLTARNLLHTTTHTAQLDADIIVSTVLSINRNMLDLMQDIQLDTSQREWFESLLARRIDGEPVAYITETKEFWSLRLRVTPATLVPRPETELVVERVLVHCSGLKSPLIADLGTGSGAIALAVASELSSARIMSTDLSAEALRVAEENYQCLGFHGVQFFHGDWTDALPCRDFDILAANPPYIAENDPCLQDRFMKFEPQLALSGGKDGLAEIRRIISSAADYLKTCGWLVIEHGWDQGDAVRREMKLHGFTEARTFKDLAGLQRVTEGYVKK